MFPVLALMMRDNLARVVNKSALETTELDPDPFLTPLSPPVSPPYPRSLVGNYAFYHITQVMTPRLTMFPPAHRPTLSFFFSYLLELPLQHFLNALICYKLSTICGQYPGQYLRTLGLTYATYINAIWITTLLKAQLARFVEEKWAFIGSVYGVGIVNMFVLGRLMKDKEGGKK